MHEQLRGNFRGGERSWHDPTGRHSSPRDTTRSHGTQVLSAAVGQNRGKIAVGVAPGAQWIACAGFFDRMFNNVRPDPMRGLGWCEWASPMS